MNQWEGKRSIPIVSACMTPDGRPTFALNQVEVTKEEAENGIHYYLAEANLLLAGYEEPFLHFSQEEAPPWLLPAVQQQLGLATTNTSLEGLACPASSK